MPPPDFDPTILLVDDDPIMARSLVRYLRGQDVVVASGGAEALARLSERRFALVLLDLGMPAPNGAEVFETTEAQDPAQAERIALMTGGNHEVRYASLLDRFEGPVLVKPFAPEALDALLERFGLTGREPAQ